MPRTTRAAGSVSKLTFLQEVTGLLLAVCSTVGVIWETKLLMTYWWRMGRVKVFPVCRQPYFLVSPLFSKISLWLPA